MTLAMIAAGRAVEALHGRKEVAEQVLDQVTRDTGSGIDGGEDEHRFNMITNWKK